MPSRARLRSFQALLGLAGPTGTGELRAAVAGVARLEGGPDVLISIRVFDSADEALASNEIAATWMRENVLEFVKGMPEVMAGNVLVAADK